MKICLPSLDIRLIDSFNFLPLPLSKFPKTFGFEELTKGYFPHLFNIPENEFYRGPLPDAKYYSPDTMTVEGRREFLSWYKSRKEYFFDFREEIYKYCKSDVDILRRCCLSFREEFISATKIDPFQYTTIASACMATYRSQYIPPQTIGLVPVHGYVNRTNHSISGIQWIDFIALKEKIQIRHARNGFGEQKIANISVDGFCETNNTVYQFYGKYL
ncbi:probable DNA polymerase [Stegodyphus dumicola]|uniref:probable DNA polymerase n=1 Tax=Stegodyphus dumicola TaxID=202533 RepID=UPI0015AB102B|nr:probable DNA polymerase [Stegodyphus dumicola]